MRTQRCSRCRKILTDYASMEAGVGPICRSRNNHLYAKLIEANGLVASINFLRNDIITNINESCQERFTDARDSFVNKFTKIQRENHDITKLVIDGADFRKEVETLDYILSFRMPMSTRETLISIIKNLGYVGLAAVINGEASKSKANIYFKNSRVFLEGAPCKAGWVKMRKLPGIITPRYRADKTPFSAPAEECKNFIAIVFQHWPLFEGSPDAIQAKANSWLKSNKSTNISNLENNCETNNRMLLKSFIKQRTNDFTLTFTWSNDASVDTYSMLAEIKSAIPYKERKYIPSKKTWMFINKHYDTVRTIVNRHYPELEILFSNPPEQTPRNLWTRKSNINRR